MEHSNPILMGNDSPQKFITIGEVMLRRRTMRDLHGLLL